MNNKIIILCILSLLYSTVIGSSIGLIVGEVTEHEAKILYWKYESLSNNENGNETQTYNTDQICSISMFPPSSAAAFSIITLEPTPQILELSRLKIGVNYIVNFHCGSNSNEEETAIVQSVQFKTLPLKPEPIKLLFHSCNRLSEESDFVMWNKLQESSIGTENTLHIHMGDQIYADKVSKINRDHCVTYNDILKAYRQVYTESWNYPVLSNILRNHSHLMLLDDHDIVNNFNKEKWRNTDPWMKAFARAGIQSFLQYQHHLHSNIPHFSFVESADEANCCLPYPNGKNLCSTSKWDKFDELVLSLPYYGSKEYGNIGLLWLDTRSDRAFSSHGELFGKVQLDYVKETLIEWNKNDNIHEILIISGVPLIYQSTFMSLIAYYGEGERYLSHPDLVESTGELLDIIFEYPEKITLISGDIHMYLNSSICRGQDNVCIKQYITSGMTTKSSTIRSWHLYLYAFFAVWFFTPYVYTDTATYYLDVSKVFLDNNYLQYTYNGIESNWIVTLREFDNFYLEVLQRLFSVPHVYTFFIYSIIANLSFIILSILYVCCCNPTVTQKQKEE